MSAERPLVAVVDYGIGNLHSAQKSIERQGADARLTADPGLIADAAGVVLPGVGAFGACMDALRRTGLEEPTMAAIADGRPFLGICVGSQLLFEHSEESPGVRGLGVFAGTVTWLSTTVKRPQIQWNQLDLIQPDEPMFTGLGAHPWFYFVHSLHGVPNDAGIVAATCDYGGSVNAAFRQHNVFAAQFHPEKSASAGLGLLANFVDGLTSAPVAT